MSYCTVCDAIDTKPAGRCPACGRNWGPSILDGICQGPFDDPLRPQRAAGTVGAVKPLLAYGVSRMADNEAPARTPRTDEAELSLLDIQNGHGPSPYVPAELARQLERELYAALVCAGVASLERGEWAAEREELIEAAALECDSEAQTQGIYANEAGSPGLRLVHSTASNTLMAVAHRIRALKAGLTA